MSAIDVLREHWDLPLLLVAFAALIAYSFTLEQVAREFPLVFLLGGFVFLSIELVAYLAPEKYTRAFVTLTSGLASDMDTESLAETEGEEVGPAEEHPSTPQTNRFLPESLVSPGMEQLVLTSVLLVGFVVLSYALSFLFVLPFFIFGVVYVIGSGNLRNALITSVVLVAAIWFLFGDLLNVPILEGTLVDWSDIIREVL